MTSIKMTLTQPPVFVRKPALTQGAKKIALTPAVVKRVVRSGSLVSGATPRLPNRFLNGTRNTMPLRAADMDPPAAPEELLNGPFQAQDPDEEQVPEDAIDGALVAPTREQRSITIVPPSHQTNPVGTGALGRCEGLGDAVIELPSAFVNEAGYPLIWQGTREIVTLPVKWIDSDTFLRASPQHRAEVMSFLEKQEIWYTWNYPNGFWKNFTARGDVAFLGHLLQTGQHEALAGALAAHGSKACTSKTKFPVEDIIEKLQELAKKSILITDKGAMTVLRSAVEDSLRDGLSPDPQKHPIVEQPSNFLSPAGTFLASVMKSALKARTQEAFSKELKGFFDDLIEKFPEDENIEKMCGLIYGSFLGACFKLSQKMTNRDREVKDFVVGSSDSFFNTMSSLSAVWCPPAAVCVAAVGAVCHFTIGKVFKERDFKAYINKWRADIQLRGASNLDPREYSEEARKRADKIIRSQNFLNHINLGIQANGFS